MSRVGPADFTLDEIAREVGVTAGALVQRFGSKRELMVALSAGWAEGTPSFLDQLRAKHESPLETIRAYAECMGGLADSPSAFVRSLAYLQADLSDPDLRVQLEKHARATRAGLESLIDGAIAAGELKSATNAKNLARTIDAVLSGSLMTWVYYQEAPASKWIREDVDNVLAPYVI